MQSKLLFYHSKNSLAEGSFCHIIEGSDGHTNSIELLEKMKSIHDMDIDSPDRVQRVAVFTMPESNAEVERMYDVMADMRLPFIALPETIKNKINGIQN